MPSRFLFEIDPEGFASSSWDALTDEVLCTMVLADADPGGPSP